MADFDRNLIFAQIQQDADRLNRLVNGEATDSVDLEGRTVGSIQKQVNDALVVQIQEVEAIQSQVNTARDEAQSAASGAQGSEELAGKWAAESVDVVVEAGLFSARHYATKAGEFSSNADTKAQEASDSADSSASSAADSETSRQAAEAAKTGLEEARDAAQASADAASESANAASGFLSSVQQSASNAAQSESNAQAAATSASDTAVVIEGRVSDAEQAATSAQSFASSAENSSNSALSAAQGLETARDEAQGFRDEAETFKNQAEAAAADVDGNTIVTVPGSGGTNEAGTAYAEDSQEDLYDGTEGRLAQVGSFGGPGTLEFTLANHAYPLSNIDANPTSVKEGTYYIQSPEFTSLPFPAGQTYGRIRVEKLTDNRTRLVAMSGGQATGVGEGVGFGDIYERIWWSSLGWLSEWKNISDVWRRGVAPDFRSGDDPVAPLLAAGSYGGYGRIGGVGFMDSYPLRDINSAPWGVVPEGNYAVNYDQGLNDFETENLPFEVTGDDIVGTIKVENLTWGYVKLTAIYEGDDPVLPANTRYERIWGRYNNQNSTWQGPWRRLGDAKYRDVLETANDLTPGKLMPSGSYGLGFHDGTLNVLFDTDFNTFTEFCGTGTTSGTWSNGPMGDGAAHTGMLFQQERTFGNSTYQKWVSQIGATPQVYHRTGRRDQGTWTKWERIYDSGNILGTVSQSGGVPTGAIIERGSNSFGEWAKFADGSAEAIINVSQDLSVQGSYLYTLPIAFVNADYVTGYSYSNTTSANRHAAFNGTLVLRNGTEQVRVWITATDPNTTSWSLTIIVKGRWY